MREMQQVDVQQTGARQSSSVEQQVQPLQQEEEETRLVLNRKKKKSAVKWDANVEDNEFKKTQSSKRTF